MGVTMLRDKAAMGALRRRANRVLADIIATSAVDGAYDIGWVEDELLFVIGALLEENEHLELALRECCAVSKRPTFLK